jgi:biopolymer transport protein ExbD
VTLAPHDAVPHQRLVDVLNACAEAGIRGVSLAGGGGDE